MAKVIVDNVEITVHQYDIILECNVGDTIDSFIGKYIGQRCWRMETCGDGACGVHAVFGKPECGELRLPNPRRFLRELLGEQADVIKSRVRTSKLGLLDTVLSALWTELVVPYATRDPQSRPNEEAMFLDRLEKSSLWPSVLRRLEEDQVLTQQGDELKARCGELSASIFLPELKKFL